MLHSAHYSGPLLPLQHMQLKQRILMPQLSVQGPKMLQRTIQNTSVDRENKKQNIQLLINLKYNRIWALSIRTTKNVGRHIAYCQILYVSSTNEYIYIYMNNIKAFSFCILFQQFQNHQENFLIIMSKDAKSKFTKKRLDWRRNPNWPDHLVFKPLDCRRQFSHSIIIDIWYIIIQCCVAIRWYRSKFLAWFT